MDVLVLARPALPELSIRLITEAGAALEQEHECGVAELTGRLLTEGAAGRDAMEMAALQRNISKTGELALQPVLRMSRKELWQIYMLEDEAD